MLEPADRDAVLANVAIRETVPDYRVIVEIACIRSPEELLGVKRAYQNRYKHSLEEDLASYTAGDIRKASKIIKQTSCLIFFLMLCHYFCNVIKLM